MPQPTRRERTPAVRKKKVKKTTPRGKRPHPKYGTSKLEDRFAKEFLDRLGYKYIRQYEAREIGRFYDFCILREDGRILALVEVDGDYFHGYGLVYEEKSPMQKRNERVDKAKDLWAHEHQVPLLRIWEHDINNNPSGVLKKLKSFIGVSEKNLKGHQPEKKRERKEAKERLKELNTKDTL